MSFPFFGEEFTFTQPDGARLPVRGWGDQNQAVFETLDGYTVTRDPITGFYQYATVDADASELLPTGVRPGVAEPRHLGLKDGVRISREAAAAMAEVGVGLPEPWWKTRRQQVKGAKRAMAMANVFAAPPARQTIGDYAGLCLLVEFSDMPGTIPRDEVDAFCNQPGYGGFGNNGSVYDYFLDNSVGKLRYATIVAPYYTARHPRAYYTNPAAPYGQRARELIREALAYHVAQGFDFGGLTTDVEDHVYATSVFYAGNRVNNWSEGLWPHASRLLTPYPVAPGVRAYDYQITDIGSALTLGTYCHENGHMLCDFPDLYDYGAPGIQSGGIGSYCLMCAGGNANRRNPVQICAYLKHQAGWANSVTPITTGLTAQAPAGTNDFFVYARNAVEYFILENRQRSGRDAALPDSGLAIWHVDELGSNNNEQMTPGSHYECSLEQADGQFDLEHGQHAGDEKDLFHAGWRDRFADSTTPSSKWWDGTASGLDVYGIGPTGTQMTFSANRPA
ncbi:MAG: M6 family metalloprotease domain-containing protein [Planctomycetales bacterium]|nr:M6 family metalloprotease domain-containing protein [Planctomycetales bacterium]